MKINTDFQGQDLPSSIDVSVGILHLFYMYVQR